MESRTLNLLLSFLLAKIVLCSFVTAPTNDTSKCAAWSGILAGFIVNGRDVIISQGLFEDEASKERNNKGIKVLFGLNINPHIDTKLKPIQNTNTNNL